MKNWEGAILIFTVVTKREVTERQRVNGDKDKYPKILKSPTMSFRNRMK